MLKILNLIYFITYQIANHHLEYFNAFSVIFLHRPRKLELDNIRDCPVFQSIDPIHKQSNSQTNGLCNFWFFFIVIV